MNCVNGLVVGSSAVTNNSVLIVSIVAGVLALLTLAIHARNGRMSLKLFWNLLCVWIGWVCIAYFRPLHSLDKPNAVAQQAGDAPDTMASPALPTSPSTLVVDAHQHYNQKAMHLLNALVYFQIYGVARSYDWKKNVDEIDYEFKRLESDLGEDEKAFPSWVEISHAVRSYRLSRGAFALEVSPFDEPLPEGYGQPGYVGSHDDLAYIQKRLAWFNRKDQAGRVRMERWNEGNEHTGAALRLLKEGK
jgi:hypothetical protein